MPHLLQVLLPTVCVLGGYTLLSLLNEQSIEAGYSPTKKLRNKEIAAAKTTKKYLKPKTIGSGAVISATESNGTLFFMRQPHKPNGAKKLDLLPRPQYSRGGTVIVTLITDKTTEVTSLQSTLKSLAFLQGDEDVEYPAPVIVYTAGINLNKYEMTQIMESTNRPLGFCILDFSEFPAGFDSDTEQQKPREDRIDKWDIEQVNRFWINKIWKHTSIKRFETIMKISPDSCFKEPNFYLPHFAHEHIVYHSQYIGDNYKAKGFQEGLYPFAASFLGERNKKPQNPLLWQHIANMVSTKSSVPTFDSNFEVMRKSFMTQADVAEFLDALTEVEPYGVFRQGWDIATVRLMLMAMYTTDDYVMKGYPEGYYRRFSCSKAEVDEALASYFSG